MPWHELVRTAYRSPWQKGVAERWVGSCRWELLDHVIVLNESISAGWFEITSRITTTIAFTMP